MTKARKQRLAEARKWFPEQNFAEDSHIVKAYRKRFSVDVNCAMLELCMLGVLSPEKQKSYEQQLAAKKWKSTEKRKRMRRCKRLWRLWCESNGKRRNQRVIKWQIRLKALK